MDEKVLYLTAEEQQRFQALPAALKTGWNVQPEVVTFRDDPDQFMLRAKSLNVKSQVLLDFQKRCSILKSEEDVLAAVEAVDFSSVNDDDILELLFVIGPQGLSATIVSTLEKAKTMDEVGQAGALSVARHTLLATMPVSKA